MKAALNWIPSLSILDDWWTEGCIEGVTGWSIQAEGQASSEDGDRDKEADSLYAKLEQMILPLYYGDRNLFLEIM